MFGQRPHIPCLKANALIDERHVRSQASVEKSNDIKPVLLVSANKNTNTQNVDT